LFPIVSAASIVAKITRDRILQDWTFTEGSEIEEGEEKGDVRLFGSGYPSGQFPTLPVSIGSPREVD